VDLISACGLDTYPAGHPLCVTFVGAGGKTTAMVQLARQLLNQYSCIILTTTTHLAEAELQFTDCAYRLPTSVRIFDLDTIKLQGLIGISGQLTSEGKLKGLSENLIQNLWEAAKKRGIPLLVEADGSNRKPLKAPAVYEPVIPGFSTHVVVTAGLSGLGKRLDEKSIHRPEIFTGLAGQNLSEPVTPEGVSRVLTAPMGGLKGIPKSALRILLLNQLDTLKYYKPACVIAQSALPIYDRVILAQLAASPGNCQALYQPVAGIILAAGAASRYGKTKQLEKWGDRTVIEHVIRLAIQGGLNPVCVVLGYDFENIRSQVMEMQEFKQGKFQVILNDAWEQGQSTSIRAGIASLPENAGGALFLLADQPMLPVEILSAIQDVRAFTRSWVIAPRQSEQPGNPVFFGWELFPELMALSGDSGGRQILRAQTNFPVSWLPWDDPGLVLDIDTWDDYLQMKEMDCK